MARVKARILADTTIDGVGYKVNQVVAFDEKHAEQLKEAGAIDTSAAAVKYCVEELDAEPVEHAAAEAKPAAKTKKK
jgi:hypothetical protein